MAKYETLLPPDDREDKLCLPFPAPSCFWAQRLEHIPPQGKQGSGPTDLLEPQPLGICPKHMPFSLPLLVDFALANGSAPLMFPSRKPGQAHDKFKKVKQMAHEFTNRRGHVAPVAATQQQFSRFTGSCPFRSFRSGIQIFRKQPLCTNRCLEAPSWVECQWLDYM